MPTLNIRLTEEQAKRLEGEAEAFGLTKGSWVKSRLFGKAYSPRRVPRPDQKELARIVGQLGKVGSNLNQIAHHLNSNRSLEIRPLNRSLIDARIEMAEVHKLVREALGLKPIDGE